MGITMQQYECGCVRIGRNTQTENFDWKLCKDQTITINIKNTKQVDIDNAWGG